MIGFKHSFSAREAKEHRDKLISTVSDGYKHEIEQIYEWMTNETFLTALQVQTIEQWQYCKRSMENPPILFIDDAIKHCEHTIPLKRSYPTPYTSTPLCTLCNSVLAKSTTEKIKFCILSCHCVVFVVIENVRNSTATRVIYANNIMYWRLRIVL